MGTQIKSKMMLCKDLQDNNADWRYKFMQQPKINLNISNIQSKNKNKIK